MNFDPTSIGGPLRSIGTIVGLATGSMGTSVRTGGSVSAGGWLGSTGASVAGGGGAPTPKLHAPRVSTATIVNAKKTYTLLMDVSPRS